MTPEPAGEHLRADAQRNRDAVLAAAHRLFAERGIDIPLEDIGREAGVGKGTLYRHFPTREHLYAAVSAERFGALIARADELTARDSAWDALATWLADYDRSAHHYRGLSARVSEGFAAENSAMGKACGPMKERARQLLRTAQDAGVADPALDVRALLTMVSSLPDDFRDNGGGSALLPLVLRGIRAGA